MLQASYPARLRRDDLFAINDTGTGVVLPPPDARCARLVLVPVMYIREVRMRMSNRETHVRMGVRLIAVVRKIMLVLVMFVVAMAMRDLAVLAAFRHIRPDGGAS